MFWLIFKIYIAYTREKTKNGQLHSMNDKMNWLWTFIVCGILGDQFQRVVREFSRYTMGQLKISINGMAFIFSSLSASVSGIQSNQVSRR